MPKIIDDALVYQAVIRVVSERGYASATTKQMAEAANISEVTLFRKYGSKPELVNQAVAAMIQRMDFDAAIGYSGDLEADLLRVVKTYQNTVVSYRLFFSVILSEFPKYPELAESFEMPRSIFRSIQELLLRYQKEGAIKEEDPAYAVAALLGPMMYLSMMDVEISKKLNLQDHIEAFLDGHSPD
jgi:AcrR family transcriptional regulator